MKWKWKWKWTREKERKPTGADGMPHSEVDTHLILYIYIYKF